MNTGMFTLVLSLVGRGLAYPCASPSYVDSYTNLPAAPTAPTQQLAAGYIPTPNTTRPLIQNHWSETANLAAYRPTATTGGSNTQQNCPHQTLVLKNWHDASTWGTAVPSVGSNVVLPDGVNVLVSSCSVSTTPFGLITVPATSSLVFADAVIDFRASGFNVIGSLIAGSATCRLRNKVTITVVGSRGAQALPADSTVKGFAVTGKIDVHGVKFFPTWTRLAMTANPGDNYVFIQDLVNWQIGQTIVVTTTELKDTREWHRNEERTITSVNLVGSLGPNVVALGVNQPLSYKHYGGTEYQAEVSLLSRNILIQGDANSEPTDATNIQCTDASDGSTYQCANSYLTGYGVHIQVIGETAEGRFSGVEVYRGGQTNQLARYPIHFHMMGNITARNNAPYTAAFARDCSVHHSFFRCYAIHGTSGVLLSENTAYDAVGHCYFLEDGVEELNILQYNQAAWVQPLGPYTNPSTGTNGDSFYGQGLSWYYSDTNLILPSDISAGCFYITNTFNDFIGNAASGGWTGFAFPSLQYPVKLHSYITNMSPANRPFRSPFRGNSAHSSGFWFGSAGAFYVGGQLKHDFLPDGPLLYTAGRSLSRDTCADQTSGTMAGSDGCYNIPDKLWLRFEDNKVFLANRGMQNWGNRAEIIRFEIHDTGLSMNVFGQVWIDSMLMACRSKNLPTFFSGCPTAGAQRNNVPWGVCNVRDFYWWSNFGGFQWYDVGQQHILTNTKFRNCNENWSPCVYSSVPGVCDNTAVFTSLTHSDQFVPELMQITSGITYENCGKRWRYSTSLTAAEGYTVSGRDQSWYDPDGSASTLGVRTMIGSARANLWWMYNPQCTLYSEAYACPLASGDSAASIILHNDTNLESQIGSSVCRNGGGGSCPLIAYAYHFGMNASYRFEVELDAKITGPLIMASGGWYIEYISGTPKVLTMTNVQVQRGDVLLIAIPYPSGTKFTIQHQAASWCGSWAVCTHNFRAVSSISAVETGFGDVYYWDNTNRLLYLRVVQTPSTFGSPGSDKNWTSIPVIEESFSRGGYTLQVPSYQSSIVITATTCATSTCPYQTGVSIPPARGSTASPTQTMPTRSPTQTPPTPAPTRSPTQATTTTSPSRSPTQTTAPTRSPTQTSAPTRSPTQATSTGSPTRSPTNNPTTPAPSRSPTKIPTTAVPTRTPTSPSTLAPTQTPTSPTTTRAPTSPTTSAPTQSPTTPNPTQSPTTTAAPRTTSPTSKFRTASPVKNAKDIQLSSSTVLHSSIIAQLLCLLLAFAFLL